MRKRLEEGRLRATFSAMAVGRRELLRNLGGLYASLWLPGCANEPAPEPFENHGPPAFLHGVASGDPLADAVVLWTRVTPTHGHTELMSVRWYVASDLALKEIVAQGTVTTDAERDFTVKVDATGLEPDATYYYRFEVGAARSPIGRTRTAPNGKLEQLRFAVVSCASYAHGYFHAYRGIAERLDLNAVLHLGDYIYEYGDGQYGSVRAYDPPHEILTLEDYRRRYAHYRRDNDLRALHQQHPMIAIWDDHEIANNAWPGGAQNHNPEAGEGEYAPRRAAATRAYLEWMPIREGAGGRTYRRLAFGDLADLVMLDTRLAGRTLQIDDPDDPNITAEDRTVLGSEQEAWLGETLQKSAAKWRLIGQQVMVGPMPYFFNGDAWSGYPAARKRLLKLLEQNPDSVVLTGDIHMSFACNLSEDPRDAARFDKASGRGSVGVEFVTPAISSPPLDQMAASVVDPVAAAEPHLVYWQLWKRGYMVIDVNRERVQAAYHHYEVVETPANPGEVAGAVYAVYAGERFLRRESAAASASGTVAAPAPWENKV